MDQFDPEIRMAEINAMPDIEQQVAAIRADMCVPEKAAGLARSTAYIDWLKTNKDAIIAIHDREEKQYPLLRVEDLVNNLAYRTKRAAAFRASRLLVEAYDSGEANGGSVDWDDIDEAYKAACEALGRTL